MKIFLALLVLSFAPSMTQADEKPAASPAAADASGTWNLNVETDSGSGNPVFTFKQEGETLTGTYKGVFGEAPVTGSLKGNEIKFTVKVSAEGDELTINYTGTIEGSSIKGTVQLGSFGDGTFTGKKEGK